MARRTSKSVTQSVRRVAPSPLLSPGSVYPELQSDYAAAKDSKYVRRRMGLPSTGAGADWHLRSEPAWLKLVERARDFDRNDVIVAQGVDRAVTNTLQAGIQLDPQTGDRSVDQDLWARWQAWSNDPQLCDVAGELTFDDIAWHCLRSALVDGDVFALATDSGALQVLEAHRVRTPRGAKGVVLGVELDALRRRVAYHVQDEREDGAIGATGSRRIPAYAGNPPLRQVMHVMLPRRASQSRGVTAFAPMFDVAGMFEDLQFAKLVQSQVVSCFAVLRTTDAEIRRVPYAQRGAATTETESDGSTLRREGVRPGMELRGAPGERLEGFSPNVPNAEFFDHARLILTLIGINLGLPLVLLTLDSSETNFSGWRGAVDQARIGFRRNQRQLIQRLLRPVYLWKLHEWTAADPVLRAAAARVNITAHAWQPPTWPYIEPWKDADADRLRLESNLISPRRLYGERGYEWETIVDEIVADRAYLVRTAAAEAESIARQFPGVDVTWRDLARMAPVSSSGDMGVINDRDSDD